MDRKPVPSKVYVKFFANGTIADVHTYKSNDQDQVYVNLDTVCNLIDDYLEDPFKYPSEYLPDLVRNLVNNM